MASFEPRDHPQHNHLCRVSSFFRFTTTTKLNLRLLVTAISFFHAVVAVGVVVAIVFTARAELYHNPPQASSSHLLLVVVVLLTGVMASVIVVESFADPRESLRGQQW
ncbi:unnamed protein product [Brassica oleracea]